MSHTPLSVVTSGRIGAIETKQVTMTPEWATRLLATNENNRKVSRASVVRYAESMRKGLWVLNGEAIILDTEEKLLEGQHRLMACVESQCSFETMLITGIVRDVAFSTINTGRNRTPSDALSMLGSIDPKATSTAIRMLIEYTRVLNNYSGTKANMTPQEVVAFFEEHPEIEDAAAVAGSFGPKLKPLLATSVVVSLVYLIKNEDHGDAVIRKFFERLRDGFSLQEGDPVFTLRERLQREAREGRRSENMERLYLSIRAFNAHVEGKQIKQIMGLARGGKLPTITPASQV